ncbi:Tetratricopeptide repeat family protein [Babesia bovis T2Bo]|uniref:Tetratricopeptide repeat family protein n=1 Tax=Babesia bovis T2Bo TaxID=484906 RepID=UPI001DD2D206|nr:Tetratricopeptide repeat family protein [Babesia bovis T2Bo]EDO07522.2 Tetratricopeptide repeat family protein [Babesia bovis T2Bo]
MVCNITTSVSARHFAERLLSEVPLKGSDDSCDKEPCSDDHSSNCGTHGSFPPGFGHDNSAERELFERDISDKYRGCQLLREEGKAAYTSGNYKLASNFYDKILIQLDYTFTDDPEWKAKFREIETSSHMNLGLCRFRLKEYRQAIFHCNRVLSFSENHVKALIRRGLCYMHLSEYSKAAEDFKKVLEIEDDNCTAREQLIAIDKLRQSDAHSERSLYTAMLGVKDDAGHISK